MFSCYIIDDEQHAIEVLAEHVLQTPDATLSGYALNPVAGLHEAMAVKPDVLFLDIDMPGFSGLDLFNLVKDQITVVFTTAHAQYAVKAFDLAAVDFLLKPIRYSRFKQSLDKIARHKQAVTNDAQKTGNDYIFIQSGHKGKLMRLLYRDILYIESFNNYITIHHTDGQHMVYLSLKDLLLQLPATLFIRIHKSFIINYEKISYIEGNRVFLKNSFEITIGVQYRDPFMMKVLDDLIKKK